MEPTPHLHSTTQYHFENLKPLPPEKPRSKIYTFFHGAVNFVKATSSMEKTALIFAIGLQIITPLLAPPLWVFSCTCLATRLAVKVMGFYTIKVQRCALAVFLWDRRRPKIKVICIIIAVAAGIFLPPAGIALGAIIGAYAGLISPFVKEIEKREVERKMPDEEQQNRMLKISYV
jgi:hypothetical protein